MLKTRSFFSWPVIKSAIQTVTVFWNSENSTVFWSLSMRNFSYNSPYLKSTFCMAHLCLKKFGMIIVYCIQLIFSWCPKICLIVSIIGPYPQFHRIPEWMLTCVGPDGLMWAGVRFSKCPVTVTALGNISKVTFSGIEKQPGNITSQFCFFS